MRKIKFISILLVLSMLLTAPAFAFSTGFTDVSEKVTYYEAVMQSATENGWSGTPNQWVIDSLQKRDVVVVDMYDKIYKGTFVGGNLATAIKNKTKTGGAVIWGGMEQTLASCSARISHSVKLRAASRGAVSATSKTYRSRG